MRAVRLAFVSCLLFLAGVSATHAATLVPGGLIKGSGPSVYYYGADSKRYVFPTEKTFFTWYTGFDGVEMITDAELGAISIGGNVTYRPGAKLLKITTDPKVYAVDAHGGLRWVQSEAVARELYGDGWAQLVDDVPDAFFVNYILSEPVMAASDFLPSAVRERSPSINQDKRLDGVQDAPVPVPLPPVPAATTTVPSIPVSTDPNAYQAAPNEFAAALVYVPATKQFIYEFAADTPRTAASLTKLASGLAVLRLDPVWSRVVSMSAGDEVGGGRLRVDPGARLSLRDLWFAAIGSSANNAIMALARVTGLTREAFVQRMNEEARAAGAIQTNLVEPSGMDPANMTTARDMAYITEAAFRDPMMRNPTTRVAYSIAVEGEAVRELKTTIAPFILDPDVWTLGGKTGYLEESMYNLVARLRDVDTEGKPVAGTDVIVVVLGAPTKDGSFQSVKHLAQWAWQHHAF
jgi:D-alanyl-D-alanine endopeptidase (penicillin-binding protein 7)